MTPATPSEATSQPAGADTPVAPGPVASIQLRAASSQIQFRILAGLYLGLMAYCWWPGAVVAGVLMPLFCDSIHPRRALWLWTAGILAGAMSLMTSREALHDLGGVSVAFSNNPTTGALSLGLGVLGVALMLWHLTWVKSPRRMP